MNRKILLIPVALLLALNTMLSCIAEDGLLTVEHQFATSYPQENSQITIEMLN